jgi:hypothetical protein
MTLQRIAIAPVEERANPWIDRESANLCLPDSAGKKSGRGRLRFHRIRSGKRKTCANGENDEFIKQIGWVWKCSLQSYQITKYNFVIKKAKSDQICRIPEPRDVQM